MADKYFVICHGLSCPFLDKRGLMSKRKDLVKIAIVVLVRRERLSCV